VAEIPEIPDWLAKKISAAIRSMGSGQAMVSWTQHRVASYDIREVGKVAYDTGHVAK